MRVLMSLLLLTSMGLAACHEGPGERAGRNLDRAGERVRDAVDPPSGPGERVGRAVDRAVH